MGDHAGDDVGGEVGVDMELAALRGGDASRVAARLRAAGLRGRPREAFDGPRWFDQGRAWREIAAELKAEGIAAGGCGYCYGNDPAGDALRAIETAQYGQADLLVLDVEAEFKTKPRAADALAAAYATRSGRSIRSTSAASQSPVITARSRSRSLAATARAPSRRSTGMPSAGRRSIPKLDVRGLRGA
ncbi:MAG: hypothetical protein E6I03_10165 [Chloroflexi bacterium]|nr:MAG: hypothetical protein E6I03_10165 [Chloroflexota bacterium]